MNFDRRYMCILACPQMLYTNINNKSEHIAVHKCVRIMSKWLPQLGLNQ